MNAHVEQPKLWNVALDLLDRLGCGGIAFDSVGKILTRNDMASHFVPDWSQQIPADVLAIVRDVAASLSKIGWLRQPSHKPLIMQALPQVAGSGDDRTLLVLIDPSQPGKIGESTVRNLFGLTAAEANLAIRLLRGERLGAIAQARGVGIGTARTQLRTIFRKTRTKSQASLILLLARLATIQLRV